MDPKDELVLDDDPALENEEVAEEEPETTVDEDEPKEDDTAPKTDEGGEDEPPAGYAALVEEFGQETADKVYAEKLGIKEPEAAPETVPASEAEAWEFEQFTQNLEEQAERTNFELTATASSMDALKSEHAQLRQETAAMQAEINNLNRLIENPDEDTDIKEVLARLHPMIVDLTEKRMRMNRVAQEHDAKIPKHTELIQAKLNADARIKATKYADRMAAKFPVISANKPLYAKLLADGKLATSTPYLEVIAALSAERVKGGGKPIGAGSGTAAVKQSTGKPATPAKMGWKALRDKLALNTSGAASRKGGATGATSAGKTKTRTTNAVIAKLEAENPALAAAHRQYEAEMAALQAQQKGDKK